MAQANGENRRLRSARSTRLPRAMSGTARSRLRSPRIATSQARRALPTLRPRSNARASADAAAARPAARSTKRYAHINFKNNKLHLQAEARAEPVALVGECCRALGTEFREECIVCRDLARPCRAVDPHHLLEALLGECKARPIDVAIGRLESQCRLYGFRAAETAFDDPTQHAHVLPEARPYKATLIIRAEPVDIENTRRSFDGTTHRDALRRRRRLLRPSSPSPSSPPCRRPLPTSALRRRAASCRCAGRRR